MENRRRRQKTQQMTLMNLLSGASISVVRLPSPVYTESVSYTHLDVYKRQGTLTEAGKEDPYSKRSVEENLDLFERMKNGEFEDGTKAVSYTHLDVYKRQTIHWKMKCRRCIPNMMRF